MLIFYVFANLFDIFTTLISINNGFTEYNILVFNDFMSFNNFIIFKLLVWNLFWIWVYLYGKDTKDKIGANLILFSLWLSFIIFWINNLFHYF